MKQPINTILMDTLLYPCFFLDKEMRLLYANPFAHQHTPSLCAEGELSRRIRANNVACDNLAARTTATILFYDVPVPYRSLCIIPIFGGYVGTLSAAPLMPEYPLNFSDQLRQPLAEIFASLPILSQHMSDPVDDLHVQRINKNCYTLLRDANILANLARLAKGAVPPAPPLDLCSLVSAVCRAFTDVALPGTPPVRFTVPDSLLPIEVEEGLVGILLENLLSNCLRFTRDGNEISVVLRRVGRQAVLTVRDRGSGIRPEVLPYVFDAYYSAPIWPENPAPGLGLGLPYVHALAALMHGSVTLESVWGEGTSVSVALPLDESGTPPSQSTLADYLTDRYSSLYIELHEFCRLPMV